MTSHAEERVEHRATVDAVTRRVQALCRDVRMLAVIGAYARLRSESPRDVETAEEMRAAAAIALGDAADSFDTTPVDPILTMIEVAFAEAADLLAEPGRAAEWNVEDPRLLRAMGRASTASFDRIVALSEDRQALADSLRGRFLDVGTGVGGIALRAAELCPDLMVDGIDVWEPALRLARADVATSPHSERISILDLDVLSLPEGPKYTLAWLPSMFMTRRTLEAAIPRIARACGSGAWIVVATYTTPADPFLAAMSRLRTRRSGGDIIDPAAIVGMLSAAGFVDTEVDASPLATFVLARLP